MRVETSIHPHDFFIFSLRMYILRLKIHILRLKMHILNLKMKFLRGRAGFSMRADGTFRADGQGFLLGEAKKSNGSPDGIPSWAAVAAADACRMAWISAFR